uniref:tyrosine-type recombinase/integrase n=1 Tax=Parerythrobacter lutipelagi TaxID=1964208 RepID=UPI0010F81BA3|nr:site-specific integrase [Parerythrobacter lutipelagi]
MATIRKRSWTSPKGEEKSAWLVSYHDQTGKRRFKQFARKKDAEVWSTQAAWEVSKGVHTADSQSVSVEAAAKLWIGKARAEGRERGTVEQYEQLARLHVVPLIGSERLSRLSRPMVEAYRDQLLEMRSKAMAGKALQALSSILMEAQRRGLVAQNVARDVKVVRSSREKPKIAIPSRDELKAILRAASDDMRPLLLTAILTALRSSELRGLRWDDVDLKLGTITVSQRADKYKVIGPPKSEAGYRTIPIAPSLMQALREWKLRCPIGPENLAFPNSQGGVQDYGHLLRRKFAPIQILAEVCDQIGVDDNGQPKLKSRYGFHALRHAAASAWIKQRIDLKRLQVWMGHSSIQITLDTYGHLLTDPSGDAAIIAAAQSDLMQ